MQRAINSAELLNTYKEMDEERIKKYYSWDTITDQYEQLFFELIVR